MFFSFICVCVGGGCYSLSMHLNSNTGKTKTTKRGYNTHLTRLKRRISHPEVCSSKSRHFSEIDLDLNSYFSLSVFMESQKCQI